MCEAGGTDFLADPPSKVETPEAPKTTEWKHVWFGWANGKPALYEYEPQYHWFWGIQYDKPFIRKLDLTFPPKDKTRTWYEEGDLILPESMTERKLFQAYPELAPPPGEEDSVLSDVLTGLILGPPDEYNIVHKIKKLTVGNNGEGTIELTSILVLDEKTFLELETSIVRNRSDFGFWFGVARSLGPLIRLMKGYVTVLYEVMMAVGTGGVSSVGRGVGRKALLMTLKAARRRVATRILARKIMTSLAKNSTKATLAGLKAFATTFAKVYRKNTDQQKLAQQKAAGKDIDRKAFDVALKEAAGAFVAAFVSALLGSSVDKIVKNSGYSEVQQEISKRIINAFGTNIPAVFINGIAKAWAAETQNPGTFEESLGKSLIDGLKSAFTSLVSVDFKKVGETLAKG